MPADTPRENSYDANGYTHVPLTVDDAELIGDALGAPMGCRSAASYRIEALALETGLLMTDYLEG